MMFVIVTFMLDCFLLSSSMEQQLQEMPSDKIFKTPGFIVDIREFL